MSPLHTDMYTKDLATGVHGHDQLQAYKTKVAI